VIHEHYRRFKRSKSRRTLIRTSKAVVLYGLPDATVVRLLSVDTDGTGTFELLKRGDHRRGFLKAGEWEWRKPEFVPGSRRSYAEA
jgi:hypothetical protein